NSSLKLVDRPVLDVPFFSTLQNTSFCPSAQAQSGRSCHRRSPLGTSRDGTGRTELFNCWLLLHDPL
ncbi:hypothetical protein NEUTE1DRAFT_148804, partial [Neurospora tetrasperma FGSC 2508]